MRAITLVALLASPAALAQPIALDQPTPPSAPTWSPDGKALAFLWAEPPERTPGLYVVHRDGKERRRLLANVSEVRWRSPRELVAIHDGQLVSLAPPAAPLPLDERKGFEHLTVSADGKQVAAVLAGDAYLFRAGAPARRLTEIGRPPPGESRGTYHRNDVEVGTATWANDLAPLAFSPDGQWLALHVVDRTGVPVLEFPAYDGDAARTVAVRRARPGDPNERREVWAISLAGFDTWRLPLDRPASMEVTAITWSSRGQLLVDRQSDDATLRSILVADPRARSVEERHRDTRDSRIYTTAGATFTADGARVIFHGDLDDRYRLYEVARGGRPAPLTPAEVDVDGAFAATPAGLFYTAQAPRPEELQLFLLPAGGRAAQQLTRRPGSVRAVPSPRGDAVAVLHSDDVTPPSLAILDVARRAEIAVTPPSPLAGLIRPRYVDIPSRTPGVTLRLKLIGHGASAAFGPMYTNTVRNRWGGSWGLIQQQLAARGHLVVQVDVRGSTGQGRAFREQFLCDFAGKDLDDIEDAVQHVVAREGVDAQRVGIFGSSFGGTLSVYALLRKPGLFTVGVAGAPAVDARWFGPDDVAVVRTPEVCPEIFARRAADLADRLRDRLLIIHGMADDVVPFKTTIDLISRFNALGKRYQLAVGPTATHAWTRGADGPDLVRRLIETLDEALTARGR